MPDNLLDDYLAAWSLSDPQLLTSTYTSHLYTVSYGGEPAVLKLLAPGETEEQRGALTLRHFAGHGAVRLLRADERAHLLEYVPGDELVTLVQRGEDVQATQVIAEVLTRLHAVPLGEPDPGLLPLERWFQALFAQAAADRTAGHDTFYARAAPVAERLLAQPQAVRVLHGDIHHYNIRQSARGWLAFDPKGLVGERTYDCANALCNPALPALVHDEARLLRNAGILADALSLDRQRILAFTYAFACLNASQWVPLGGAELIAWYLNVAAIAEPHV